MEPLVLRPIGEVVSPYIKPYHAPRQVDADDRQHPAIVRLFPHPTAHQMLHDLDGFERLWVLSWFHRISGWKAKVLPPRSRIKRGVLATRSPHRPNPVGISAVTLIGIRGLDIHIDGCDLLHGTPVIDVKPYLPYADAFPDARAGWVDAINQTHYKVSWQCPQPNAPSLVAHIERTLAADPFPHPYRRIRVDEGGTGVLAVEHLRVTFHLDNATVVVTAIHAEEPT